MRAMTPIGGASWLGTFLRLMVRYERHALNYLGFVRLDCVLILLQWG
mgnify:CR=1 FL=1